MGPVGSATVHVRGRKMCRVFCWTLIPLILFCVISLGLLDVATFYQGPTKRYLTQNVPDTRWGSLDQSGDYLVTVLSGADGSWDELRHRQVGLATHTSVEHMHWLVDTLATWTGPVSVAIFVPDLDFQVAINFVSHLTACYSSAAKQVSFHFVYPVTRPSRTLLDSHPDVGNCSRTPRDVLKELLQSRPPEMLTWRNDILYPQNLLRNTACRTLTTPYFLCPDVDMIPTSPTLASELETFLAGRASKCPRCAFVLPTYELAMDVDVAPTNKTLLVKSTKAGNARPYHVTVWKPNQKPSNLTFWETQPEEPTLRAAYKIEYEQFYEPIYVAHRTVPLFDERFVGYGYTRNSQALEMHMAGWEFHVLNNAFLIHWGFQTPKIYNKSRKLQASKNNQMFQLFMKELAFRYKKLSTEKVKRSKNK